ncbi:SpoIIAA family protein [Pirellulimonas nuda]|uniref:STAS/SEC14 domain-containing protein n=1 Tax=Pirellulimonas nuda TaxID=2528009 RepID=UPI003703D566
MAAAIKQSDVQKVVPRFVAASERPGTLKFLKVVRNLAEVDLTAFGKQIGDVFTHLGDLTHVAVVADEKWESTVANMGSVHPFEVRFFGPLNADEPPRGCGLPVKPPSPRWPNGSPSNGLLASPWSVIERRSDAGDGFSC